MGELRSHVRLVVVLQPGRTPVVGGSIERALCGAHRDKARAGIPTQGMAVGLHRRSLGHEHRHIRSRCVTPGRLGGIHRGPAVVEIGGLMAQPGQHLGRKRFIPSRACEPQ